MLALCCYVCWALRRGPLKMAPAEPCLEFLRLGYEVQRRALLGVRRGLVLFAPAILALWWGGGPVLAAKNLGVHSARVLGVLAGPTPLIVMAVVLSFIWFAFWKESRKVDREIEKYANANLDTFVEDYETYRNQDDASYNKSETS